MLMIYAALFLASFTGAMFNKDVSSLTERLAHDQGNLQLLLRLGVQYHHMAVAGDENALELSEEYLDQALAVDSGNAAAKAYRGSVRTLRGEAAFVFWKKLALAKEGIAEIDDAVEEEPRNLEIRLLRGLNGLRLPLFMQRFETSIDDFKYVAGTTTFADWPAEDRALVYYNLGAALEMAEEDQEALRYYREAAGIATPCRWTTSAKKKLNQQQEEPQ